MESANVILYCTLQKKEILYIYSGWYDGIGRRKGLKIPGLLSCMGSSPITSICGLPHEHLYIIKSDKEGKLETIEVWFSLVERLVWDQEVAGSNPVTSIECINPFITEV